MATDTPPTAGDSQTERCDECEQLTKHEVAVEIRTEGDDESATRKFSREPYRVATCRSCGSESVMRMNNA